MTESRNSSVTGKEAGRPLGFAETMDQLFIMKYSTGIYWQIGVVHCSQPLQECHVEEALKFLVRKQEALQMCIKQYDAKQKTDPEFKFAAMEDPESVNFESISINCKDEWPDIVARDHEKNQIDYDNGPLWKVILCHVESGADTRDNEYEYVFLFKISHVIADGKSVTDLFYRQFLPLLSAISNGNSSEAENMFPIVPQPQCVEEIFLTKKRFKNPVPWYFKAGLNFLRWKNRKFKAPEPPTLKFPDEQLPTEVRVDEDTACVPKVFGREICEPVIKAAKQKSVTVHTVLLVAGSMALSRTAEAASISLPRSFQQVWPIDIRKFLDYQTPQPLGDIRAGGSTVHNTVSSCTAEKFWSTCGKIYSSVKTESKQEKCTAFLGLAKYMADEISKVEYSTLFKELGIHPYMSLSNLGNVSAQAPAMASGPVQIRLTEQFFTLSGVAGMTFVPLVQLIMTYEGQFMWNIIHSPTKVTRNFVDRYYENLIDILKTFCA